jgi:predicted ATPase/DNA-binding CsgD family transcriptional regulator
MARKAWMKKRMRSPVNSDQNEARAPADRTLHSTRLPQPLTSLIGRDDQIAELHALLLLPSTRLLTLIGPGGVGKTRLALAVASTFDNAGTPVVFVPLASIRDPSLVEPSIGAAFGLGSSGEQPLGERLSFVLQEAPALLVLDNFEHVIDAAPVARELLSHCSTLTVLATSRRPLNVSGELTVIASPLDTPRSGDSRASIEQSPAVRLFLDRAAGNRTTDTPEAIVDLTAIAEICTRLDGLPLAIELAASRTRVLSPAELLVRLDRRLSLLSGGPADAPARLQSMRDAIGWSYDLLTDDEQRLLRTLAVFRGGFTLEAVEAVAPVDLQPSALELLIHVLDHSLVRQMDTAAGTSRFTMLETVREFALDALQASGEEASARERHVSWLVRKLDSPEPRDWDQLHGKVQIGLLDEHDNLRSAMHWALLQGRSYAASQIAWGLLPFWWQSGLITEGLESLQRIADSGQSLDPELRAGILCRIEEFAHVAGDDARGFAAAREAVSLCREKGHANGLHPGLIGAAMCTMWREPATAVTLFSQAVDISRECRDTRRLVLGLRGRSLGFLAFGQPEAALADALEAIALLDASQEEPIEAMRHDQSFVLLQAGWACGLLGQLERADEYTTQGLAISREFGIRTGLWLANRILGEIARARGDLRGSLHHFRDVLRDMHRQGAEALEMFLLIQTAMLAQSAGEWICAARLLGFTEAYWSRNRFAASVRSFATWNDNVDPTRSALGQDQFAIEFAAGGRLTRAGAYAEAMCLTIAAQREETSHPILTRREAAVLSHLARGQTNREIADALFVGKSTVDTHVAHILAKLGVESRRAAVRAARERGLLSE